METVFKESRYFDTPGGNPFPKITSEIVVTHLGRGVLLVEAERFHGCDDGGSGHGCDACRRVLGVERNGEVRGHEYRYVIDLPGAGTAGLIRVAVEQADRWHQGTLGLVRDAEAALAPPELAAEARQ